MSISIIDYISDCIFSEILPDSPILLIFCEEHCLVPDSLKASFIPELDQIQILKGGLFIFRTSTNFNKGCLMGLALSLFPSSKLYTPRREYFSGIIPNIHLEFLYQPTQAPKLSPAQAQSKATTGSFIEVYNESLSKFTKTFLLDRSLRAIKSRSLRAQAKNLVDGVIISLNRKYGRSEAIDSETVVNAMFDDFERHGVFRVSYNNVEYNDSLIEAFFGVYKSKIFIPGFDSRNGNEQVVDENLSSLRERQGVNGNLPYRANQSPVRVPVVASNLSGGYLRTPYFEQVTPGNTVARPDLSVFPVIGTVPVQASNVNPLIRNTTLDTQGLGNTSVTRKEPESVPDFVPASFELNTAKYAFDWGEHENKIADEILDKVSTSDEIDSILKLYRIINRTIRNYVTENGLKPNDLEIEDKLKKNMKLIIQTFYECAELNVEELVENYKTVSTFKLVRALE